MAKLQLQQKYSLENIFSPQSSLEFIGFIVIGVINSLVSNLFSQWSPVGLFGVLFLYLYWRFIEVRRARRLSKALSYSLQPKAPDAARGLILLLSPYSPRNKALNNVAILKPLIENIVSIPTEKLQQSDFDAIDILNSNLVPQIEAIKHHFQKGELRDVWLITSETYGTVKGSEISAVILEQYLRLEYGKNLRIHSQNLCVKDLEYKALSELGEKIFQDSGFKEEVMVADITGGTKMMSVALAMACIQPGRRMQYMDAQRDWQGNPLDVGRLEPVGIDVTPIIYG